MAKQRKTAPKKSKPKAKPQKGQPPEENGMGLEFDRAMTRIAKAPWPPPKKR